MVFLTKLLRWNDYHNLPKKFIERAKFNGTVIDCNYQLRGPREINFIYNYHYGKDAPWTTAAIRLNHPRKRREPQIVEPLKDWFFFRGDKVEILTGKDKGKHGNVCGIIRERNWVFVAGLNCKFHMRHATNEYPGICMKVEEPLLVTNEVRLVDPFDHKACEVEWRFTEEGEKVRVSKRTGKIIPLPDTAEETVDYKKKSLYAASEKDTTNDDVCAITFEPKLKSFYDEMMEYHKIKENRKPGPVYIY